MTKLKRRRIKKVTVKGNNNNSKPGENSKASSILQTDKPYRTNVRSVDGNMGAFWSPHF